MSVTMMALVWADPSLAPGHRLVLLAYADHADDDGICYPAVATIAGKTGYSRRQVIRATRALVSAGYLAVIAPAAARSATRYRVVAARGDTMSPLDRARGDTMSPLDRVRGDTMSPLDRVRGDTMSPLDRVRGDICDRNVSQMSPEPSRNLKNLIITTPRVRAGSTTRAGDIGPPIDGLPPSCGDALQQLLRVARSPAALAAEIRMILAGGRPGVPRDPAAVAQALQDLAIVGQPVTGVMLRTFVQRAARDRATRPDEPRSRGGPGPRDPILAELAAADAAAARGEHVPGAFLDRDRAPPPRRSA